jgi:flagellum-specific peptidoglycan hydrolase FlgJ
MKKTNDLIYYAGAFLIGLIILGRKKIINTVSNLSNKQFLEKIKPYAISIGNSIGVPYKFILAQIILETGWGKSSLASKYNNYGGIKEFGNGPKVLLSTTECKNGVCGKVMQPFAVYPTVEAGLKAQSKIYQNVNFRQYLNKTTDPIKYAELIQSGAKKYATDPNYVKNITRIINSI